ncbi:unnamed protein product [Ixodes pacificus]
MENTVVSCIIQQMSNRHCSLVYSHTCGLRVVMQRTRQHENNRQKQECKVPGYCDHLNSRETDVSRQVSYKYMITKGPVQGRRVKKYEHVISTLSTPFVRQP